MIYKVNGQVLTINNYRALLNADAAEITLGLFNDGGSITELSPSVTIIAQENLAQHPIVASNIIELGDKKIAYLAYTSFISNRSEEHTSELQSRPHLVCRLLLEKKKTKNQKEDQL